jgi:Family of unknown function (DUF6220)
MRMARLAHAWLAWLFLIALVVQVFLAGLGVFESAARFTTHRDVGYVLSLLPIVLAVLAAVGRLGRRQIGLAVVIFLPFILQSVFVAAWRGGMPAVAALHPVNGFLILVLAIELARSSWARREVGVPAGAA